jgi:hypothetical protein
MSERRQSRKENRWEHLTFNHNSNSHTLFREICENEHCNREREMYCPKHEKVYCSKCCDGLHYKCNTQELCKVSKLIDARNIAVDTLKAMEDYARVYDAEGTIDNFGPELEVFNSKMTKLGESIKQAMNADDFTKFEGLKREVKQ